MVSVTEHYDALVDENNDPVHDPQPLKDYMDRWDGEPFLSSLELNDSKSVLEIGVGTGRLAVRTAPLCKSFYGIDVSPKTVRRGRANLASYPNVTMLLGDFLQYPFTQTFDVIYSSLTFMHIEDKQAAISKTASLLNPGGRFVLSVTKCQDDWLDIGTRRLRVYPTDPKLVACWATAAGLRQADGYELEHAYVFVLTKPTLTI